MVQPRYAYLGLLGASLLVAYNINRSHQPAAIAARAVVTAPAPEAVEQPAPAAAPPVAVAPSAAEQSATAAAAAKAEADKQAADKAASDRAAADKAAAEKAAADKQAADKAAADKAASDKAAADRLAAEQAAQAKAAADAQAAAQHQAAAKAAADKAAADQAATEKAEADKAAAAKAAAAVVAPAAPVALATGSGPWDGGDAAAGQMVFHKCQLCHYGEKGRTKIGPSLWGVVGRHSGSLEGYHYSTAMASYNHVWTPENLFVYLAAPMKVVHGTKMTFIGLSSETDRKNVIAYLKTLK